LRPAFFAALFFALVTSTHSVNEFAFVRPLGPRCRPSTSVKAASAKSSCVPSVTRDRTLRPIRVSYVERGGEDRWRS
jgi:hypothetical protein